MVSAHLLAQSLLASLGRLDLHFLGSKLLPMDPIGHGKLFPCCVEFCSLAEVKLILGVQEKREACPLRL